MFAPRDEGPAPGARAAPCLREIDARRFAQEIERFVEAAAVIVGFGQRFELRGRERELARFLEVLGGDVKIEQARQELHVFGAELLRLFERAERVVPPSFLEELGRDLLEVADGAGTSPISTRARAAVNRPSKSAGSREPRRMRICAAPRTSPRALRPFDDGAQIVRASASRP